jgi:hypothetical protein
MNRQTHARVMKQAALAKPAARIKLVRRGQCEDPRALKFGGGR